ncbi:hypothetical protein [Methanobrevibacter filiformis]|uniref:Uncharacterized protein n=1 Tax=Methanobrevibacter filiformis TaxID=55758 RepID=A0A166F431_9EURY|nr:hypothetical protein [Methanobrevibacter filiformis]KZX17291.1 hypothetical protein MBFIL_02520 [Methanobrevibacter filiformis]
MTIVMEEIIRPDLLKRIELRAKKENITEEKLLNEFIEEGLEKREHETLKEKVKCMSINNPTNKLKFEDLKGIIKLDERTNAVELKKQAHIKD